MARQDPNFKARERAEKMLARQDPNFKARERAEKKFARQDPNFKANEQMSLCISVLLSRELEKHRVH